jgi:23S rRNA (uridine2552-2'-O)-methyltransferase
VYKLDDLLRRAGGLPRGATVVELGCWPGGWLQRISEAVGPSGRVVGVDVEPFEPLGDTVIPLVLDITEPDAVERIEAALGRPAHAVLSDAAPKLTGIADVDRSAGAELCAAALAVAQRVLRPKGFLIVKDFPGPESKAFGAELRRAFARVSEIRPEGRRATSKEFYWLAQQKRESIPDTSD